MKFFILIISATCALAHHGEELHTAIAHLIGSNVQGNVTFKELEDHQVQVQGSITGLPAGQYGFHVHEKGDISGGCGTTGGHFNPNHQPHGHPTDLERHVGDLGNIEFNSQGASNFNFLDREVSLRGANNILGRAVVLHERADDYGRTKSPDSRKTGNAGGRVACGVIGLL